MILRSNVLKLEFQLVILPPEDRVHLLELLREAHTVDVLVAFDPNLRPALWSGANEMRDTIMVAAAGADIPLPSFEDEAVHFGDASRAITGKAGSRILVENANIAAKSFNDLYI